MANEADVWASRIVAALLERGQLELVTPSTRSDVEALVAHLLDGGSVRASVLAARIIEQRGVAELHCDDDELGHLVAASRPAQGEVPTEDAEPPARVRVEMAVPPALGRLDPQAWDIVMSAAAVAEGQGHRATTLDHVLAQMLEVPAITELARKRGGDPDAARARVREALARFPHGGSGAFDDGLLAALAGAEELAPTSVTAGDIVLAVRRMAPRPERALFELAFDPPAPPTVAAASESDDSEESPASERPLPTMRVAGALVTSTDFAEVWRLVHALAQRERGGERWARADRRPGELPLHAITHAEAELGTTLPDDFWAAAGAGVMGFSRLGVTPTPDHGEPVSTNEVAEAVLTVASNAASELDDDAIAIMDLRETGAGARVGRDFVCVRRGVSFSQRNTQPVFVAGADGLERQGTFATYLLRVLRETDAAIEPTKPAPAYRPRLVDP